MNWRRGKFAIANAIHLELTHQQEHYAQALRRYVRHGDKWLDVGCGHNIVPDWAMSIEEQKRLVNYVSMLVGVDTDEGISRHPLLTHRIKAVGENLPFKDEVFDLITANMVVEHVAHPREFMAEMSRVLKPGGRFLFITPNRLSPWILLARMIPGKVLKRVVHHLEARDDEDIFPTRYRMNKPSEIVHVATDTRFEAEELNLVGTCGEMDCLGPVAWLECFLLKAVSSSFQGKLQPDILAVLRRKDAA